MVVGELFLSAFLQVLFDRLASPELLNFVRREGIGKKADTWSKTLKRIEAVLDDADEKQNSEREVKDWLDDLRDLAYDVEDILDDFATEALRRRLTGGNQATTTRTAFTSKKNFGKEAREAAWAAEQRTLHGLQSVETKKFSERHTFRDISLMAEEAKRRAEIARLRELRTLKGKVESFAKLRGLDIDAVNQHYTV